MLKQLNFFRAYLKGIGLQSLVIVVLSCLSVYTAIHSIGVVTYSYENYRFFLESNLAGSYNYSILDKDRFYPENITTVEDMFKADREFRAFLTDFSESPAVEALVVDQEARVSLQDPLNAGKHTTVVLLSEDFLELFPVLAEKMPFDDPDAVYLCGDIYGDVSAGDTLTWQIGAGFTKNFRHEGEMLPLKVAGYLSKPYTFPAFNTAGTSVTADNLAEVREDDCIFMLATAKNVALVEEYLDGFNDLGLNAYIRFQDDADEAEVNRIVKSLEAYGILHPVDQVWEDTLDSMRAVLRAQIPRAVMMLFITLVSFVSMIDLTVDKKRKEMAIAWLCGCTKLRSVVTAVSAAVFITLPATLFGLGYLKLAPTLERQGYLDLFGMTFDDKSYWIVFGYFAISLVIAVSLTLAMTVNQSPVSSLRRTRE